MAAFRDASGGQAASNLAFGPAFSLQIRCFGSVP